MNKTNFPMKGFAPGLALKQRQKATWKLHIAELKTWAPVLEMLCPSSLVFIHWSSPKVRVFMNGMI